MRTPQRKKNNLVLRLRWNPPGIWDKAKCKNLKVTKDTDCFFSEDEVDLYEATVYCTGEVDKKPCPIQQECLVFALTNNCREGVWGSSLPSQRKWVRQQYPLKGKVPRPEWTLKIIPPANALGEAYKLTEADYESDNDEDY